MVIYLTPQELSELELFDKTHIKIDQNWKLYFVDERNIISQKLDNDNTCISEQKFNEC